MFYNIVLYLLTIEADSFLYNFSKIKKDARPEYRGNCSLQLRWYYDYFEIWRNFYG